jgi:transposase
MKDGSTHLAHKAEHAVDMESGAVVAVTLQAADLGDTTTVHQMLAEAGMAVAELVGREAELLPDKDSQVNIDGIEELVADKGYHSGAVVEWVGESEVLSYIPARRGRPNIDTGGEFKMPVATLALPVDSSGAIGWRCPQD